MRDPHYVTGGPGPGGGPGGTHIYADLVEAMQIDSPQAKQFVLVVTLGELASYASSIRDVHPETFKVASLALDAATRSLARSYGVPGME